MTRVLTASSWLNHELGEAFRKGNACLLDFLFNVSIDKRAEDIQDRSSESIRPEMRHPGNRRRGRADIDVRRRIVFGEDDV